MLRSIVICPDEEMARHFTSAVELTGKPGRGACWNHAMNSFSAMLYTRFVIGEETPSSTRAFNFSHWAIFSSTTKSFIFSPFNGPHVHYLLVGGHIKQGSRTWRDLWLLDGDRLKSITGMKRDTYWRDHTKRVLSIKETKGNGGSKQTRKRPGGTSRE